MDYIFCYQLVDVGQKVQKSPVSCLLLSSLDLLEIKTSCQDYSKSSEPLEITLSQKNKKKACVITVPAQTELCKVNKYPIEGLPTFNNCDDFNTHGMLIGKLTFASSIYTSSSQFTDSYRGEFVRLYLQNFNIDCTIPGMIGFPMRWIGGLTMTQSMSCKIKAKESELTVTSRFLNKINTIECLCSFC